MKRLITTAVIPFLIAGALLAQRPFSPRAGSGGTPPDPATRIANQVARLTTLLDLTTAQAAQATTILTNAESAVSGLQTTLSTDQTALESAIKANATSTIDQLSAAIGTIDGQILDARSKAEASLYAILTAAQQAKVDTMGGPRLLGGGGPGGPGGRGPRP